MALSDNTNSPAIDNDNALSWIEGMAAIGGLAITAIILYQWYRTGKVA